jgi:hypothetical protein
MGDYDPILPPEVEKKSEKTLKYKGFFVFTKN